MNSWIRTTVTDQHRDALSGKKVVGAIQGQIWYLPKDIQRNYDIIEEFIIRCLTDLTPTPSDEEIASLFGFDNVRFISQVSQQLKRKSVVVLAYRDPANSTRGWEVFDCEQGEKNSLLQEAAKLSGVEAEYESFFR